MKQLQHLRPLRKRLARLRRRRQRFRWATAASAVAIAVLWALAGVFALDWYFQRNVDLWQRLLLLVLAAAGVIWAFARFTLPWLGKREDDTDMALLVQRQAGIDSDLVAALQFESPDAASWGSTQLETAVIDRVAAQAKEFRRDGRHAAAAAGPAAEGADGHRGRLGLLGFLVPEHLRVFFQRLAFGRSIIPRRRRSSPSRSTARTSISRRPARRPYTCRAVRRSASKSLPTGSQPASGRVEISTAAARPARQPCPWNRRPKATAIAGPHTRANMPGLTSRPDCQIYVGDAWTDPLALSVTPLPVVEIEAEVVPPVYARQSADELQKLPRGMRQFSVLAGSEVRLKLDSDRPLDAVEVKIAEQAPSRCNACDVLITLRVMLPIPRRRREVWTLPTAGTPLASVAKELPYSIQVRDAEGQTLEQPLEGSITHRTRPAAGHRGHDQDHDRAAGRFAQHPLRSGRRSRPGPHLADLGGDLRRRSGRPRAHGARA